MTNSIENYYKILEISSKATTDEIKRAYRKKAKYLHPDINKNENAHEQFILLNEAYEYLIAYKTGRLRKTATISKENWEKQKEQTREQARKKAADYARMRYEAYKKTEHYKSTEAVFVILEHFYFFSSISLLIGLPLFGYLLKGIGGIFMGLFCVFITSPYWSGLFNGKYYLDIESLKEAITTISKNRTFHLVLLMFINIILFFTITLYTELSTLNFFFLLISIYLVAFLIIKLFNKTQIQLYSRYLYLFIIPSFFNLFFF
jgi:cation transport ATPase